MIISSARASSRSLPNSARKSKPTLPKNKKRQGIIKKDIYLSEVLKSPLNSLKVLIEKALTQMVLNGKL